MSTLLGPEATGLRGRVTFDGYGSLVGSSYRFAHRAVLLSFGVVVGGVCGGRVGLVAGGTVRCLRTAQWTRASQMFKYYSWISVAYL